MRFGIYVHIPYCIQRCHYCDFTTFERHKIIPPAQYLDLIYKEIEQRHAAMPLRKLKSLYFGGGTPSLFSAEQLISIKSKLEEVGFCFDSETEVTLEINPATLNKEKIAKLFDSGFNRYSVGAQTFNENLLKACGREHSGQDTLDTLDLLSSMNVNYSLDLLFALPKQNLNHLKQDIATALEQGAQHISAYCLTVPQGHPMNKGRAPEEEQISMFKELRRQLNDVGYEQYEISNFAKVGKESQHNLLYWQDQTYWGIGLSAHSYLPHIGFGQRFWNSKSMEEYAEQVGCELPPQQIENLSEHEALTDFCHMHLRTMAGLPLDAAQNKFSPSAYELLKRRLETLADQKLIHDTGTAWTLTEAGQHISNQVFLELTFVDFASR